MEFGENVEALNVKDDSDSWIYHNNMKVTQSGDAQD